MAIEIKENYEWYKTGAVSVSQGSRNVTGSNTEWLTGGIKKGDIFTVGNAFYEIDNVTGNNELLLVNPYSGSSVTNSAYSIIPRAKAMFLAEVAVELKKTVNYWNEREQVYESHEGRITALEAGGIPTEYQTKINNHDQKITALQNTTSSHESRITELEENGTGSGSGSGSGGSASLSRFLGRMGMYIDSDGDLAQDEEHYNPAGSAEYSDDEVASEDNVDDMINDVFG